MMKKGFTLIELLVVVLIIGILSAVALPQYQKAVKKARAAEVLAWMKTASDALEIACLENSSCDWGSWAGADGLNHVEGPLPEQFSIDLPVIKNWNCYIQGRIGCYSLQYELGFIQRREENQSIAHYCYEFPSHYAEGGYSESASVCKSLGYTKKTSENMFVK